MIAEHVERCPKCIHGEVVGCLNFEVGVVPCPTCEGAGVVVDWEKAEKELGEVENE